MDCNVAAPEKIDAGADRHKSCGGNADHEVHAARTQGGTQAARSGEADLPKTGQLSFSGMDNGLSSILGNGSTKDLQSFNVTGQDGSANSAADSVSQHGQSGKCHGNDHDDDDKGSGQGDQGAHHGHHGRHHDDRQQQPQDGAKGSGGTTPADTNAGTPAAGRDGNPAVGPADNGTGLPNTGDQSVPPASGDQSVPPASGDRSVPPANGGSSTNTNDGFTISNGQLLVNGNLLSGVAVTGQYAKQVGPEQLATEISSKFPGINVVRLATSPEGGAFTNGSQLPGGQTVDDINQTIKALNAKGIGVIIDNHGSDANTQNNVSQNGAEPAWFAELAKANLGNNMVMFQTENEPTGSDQAVVQEQQAAYNAVRTTGSNAIVAFDLVGGGGNSAILSNPDAYNKDSNYVIDAHSYASNNSDPASALRDQLGQFSSLHEANGGAVPVYTGETGDSIDGSNKDAAASQQLNAAFNATGAVAWLYDGAATGFNGVDHLTNPDGSLTGYGQEVATLIAKGAPAPSAGSDQASPPSAGSDQPSPPSNGSDQTSPPSAGSDQTSPPSAGSDQASPPSAGSDQASPASAGSDQTSPASAGSDQTSPPYAGSDQTSPPYAKSGTDFTPSATDGTLPTDLPSKFPGDLQASSAEPIKITGDMHTINDVPEALRQYVSFEGDRMVINGHGGQLPPLDLENAHNVTITDARISNANGAAIIGHNSDNIIVQNSELGMSKNEGVRFENSTGIALRGNYIHDNGDHGVEIYQSQSVDTSQNYLKDNGGAGIQYDGVSGPGNKINNNISIQTDLNKPFEDHISWLSSSGTPDSRGQINGNHIEGRSSSNSGSGITIEPGNNGRAGGGYLDVTNNTLINPGRNAMAATGGDHYSFTNNTIDQSTAPSNLESFGLITYNFVPSNPPGSDITIAHNKVIGAKNWQDPSVPAIGWDTNT